MDQQTIAMLAQGLAETLIMTVVSTLFSYVIGLPLGVVLVITKSDGIRRNLLLNRTLGAIVNILRSVPFLILLIAVIPFTRLVVGTSIGPAATVVPLVIASFPFVARLVESSISEVDKGVVEAAQSMGATTMQIICKVMITEAVPSLILGCAIAATTILSYSAMAGVIGGGGLGDIAIRYGYYRYENGIMFVTVVLLVAVVQIMQAIGSKLAAAGNRRK